MHYVNVYNGCSIFQLFFYFTNIKVIQIALIYQLTRKNNYHQNVLTCVTL